MKAEVMKNAGARIHTVCSDLSCVLNGGSNYIYWKNIGNEEEAEHCLLGFKAALCRLNRMGDYDQLIYEEQEDGA
jgi:hypothetical protein